MPSAHGVRVALVVSQFNAGVTGALRAGAEAALAEGGADGRDVEVFEVPGAFELPLAARLVAETGRFDAVVCLGCVIRGETPHFEYISSAVAQALAQVALSAALPVAFGVLTTDTLAQAEARSAPGPANKGREAVVAALEMVHLARRLNQPASPGSVRV